LLTSSREFQVLDMRADSRRATALGARESQQTAKTLANVVEVRQRPLNLVQLLVNDIKNVRTWAATRPLDRNDLFDLVEVEAEPPRPSHEGENLQRVIAVDAISGHCATRCRENACGLVEPKRLAAQAAACGDLADEQAVSSHDPRIALALKGNVKRNFMTWKATQLHTEKTDKWT